MSYHWHYVRHVCTLPAMTMRKGSVQNTRLRASASSEALMAMDSSMGSSGGMTLVMIMLQFRNSLKRLRPSSCRGTTGIEKFRVCLNF